MMQNLFFLSADKRCAAALPDFVPGDVAASSDRTSRFAAAPSAPIPGRAVKAWGIVLAAAAIAFAAFSMAGCTGGNTFEPEPPVSVDQGKLVGDALLAEASDSLGPDAECAAEGHLIMASEYDAGILTVYALTSTGGYGFLNGYFVKVSGTGVTPAVLTFSVPEDSGGQPALLNIRYPLDGDRYADSVREMIPSGYADRALNPTDEDVALIRECEQSYATAYLEEMGREAQVGEYGDFPTVLLTDLGVSVEVSNMILERQDGLLEGWPLGVGTCERVEDGARYVYEMAYERGDDFITFTRTVYDTGETVERIYVDAATGDVMME